MKEDDDIESLLIKYIANEATEYEVAYIRRWIQAHPENEQYFVQLYEAWHQAITPGIDTIDADTAFSNFAAQNFTQPAKSNKNLLKGIMACAGLFIIAITFWVFYPYAKPDNTMSLSANRGEKRMYKLQDGTVIWLNAGSRLDISSDFNIKNRTVYLSGEAFFEIGAGKKDLPFLVKTKKFSIRDIGTKFNVKAYPEDNLFEASVMQGEVSVENGELKGMGNNRIYLKERQVLRISANLLKASSSSIQKVQINDFEKIQVLEMAPSQQANYYGWKDNVLAFEGTSLQDIATQLERHYNVSIIIADDKLKDIQYSGTFRNASSINDVLNIIEENTDINYTRSGNTITITGGKHL